MGKTIILHDDYVEVLKEGYNIIENTVYDDEIILLAQLLRGKLDDIQGVK